MNRLATIERGAGIGAALAGALPAVLVPMLLILSSQEIRLITVAFLLTALWFATLLLLVFTGLTIVSIGLLFVPSLLLALAATFAGSVRAFSNMLHPQRGTLDLPE